MTVKFSPMTPAQNIAKIGDRARLGLSKIGREMKVYNYMKYMRKF